MGIVAEWSKENLLGWDREVLLCGTLPSKEIIWTLLEDFNQGILFTEFWVSSWVSYSKFIFFLNFFTASPLVTALIVSHLIMVTIPCFPLPYTLFSISYFGGSTLLLIVISLDFALWAIWTVCVCACACTFKHCIGICLLKCLCFFLSSPGSFYLCRPNLMLTSTMKPLLATSLLLSVLLTLLFRHLVCKISENFMSCAPQWIIEPLWKRTKCAIKTV